MCGGPHAPKRCPWHDLHERCRGRERSLGRQNQGGHGSLGRELIWQKPVADDGVVIGQRTSRIDHGLASWRAEEVIDRLGGQAEAAQEQRGGGFVITLVMKGLGLGRRLGLARPGSIVGIAVPAVRRIGQNEPGDLPARPR
jgi:hypothetical protein